MLRSIRENIKGRMAKVILALIIVPFVLFGAESLLTGGGGATAVLKVNGENVDEAQLAQEMLIVRNELLAKMGENVDFEQLNQSKLTPIAVQRLLQTTLLRQAAENLNMNAPDVMLQKQIINTPAFQVDGKFSGEQLNRLLADRGLNLTFLKARLADDIRASQFQAGIALSSFAIKEDVDLLVNIVSESRTVDWVKVPIAGIKNSLVVSEQDLEAFYSENKADYLSELQVTVEYLLLDLEKYIQPVAEESLEREYTNQLEQHVADERREVSHILLEIGEGQNKDQALALMEKIRSEHEAGESFAVLAKRYSQDSGSAADGGALGYTEQDGSFPEDFEKAVFDTAEDQLAEVVETDAGLHLISVTDIEKTELPAFEELRASILAQMQQGDAQKRYVAAVEQLADIAFNAADLQEPANQLKLDVQQQLSVSRNGVVVSLGAAKSTDSDLPAFLSDSRILEALFSDDVLNEGLNTEVIEINATQSIVLRVKDTFESRQKPLNEIRQLVNKQVIAAKAQQTMNDLTQRIKDNVSAGLSFTAAVEQEGYSASNHILSWQTTDENGEILKAVFAASRKNLSADVHSVFSAQDNVIFQLTSINRADDKVIKDATQLFEQQANKGFMQRDVNAYFKSLENLAEVQRF